MKKSMIFSFAFLMLLVATTAFAERGHSRGGYYDYPSQGERIERHLDRTGDRIERRFDHKAERAEARGKYRKADRFRAQGDRINRHLDRKGERIHARHDRHRGHKHYRGHKHDKPYKHYKGHRHYYPRTKVVYRNYNPYDTYFGLVINQPGLWLGWGWYD